MKDILNCICLFLIAILLLWGCNNKCCRCCNCNFVVNEQSESYEKIPKEQRVVLSELGYSEEEIAEMEKEGISEDVKTRTENAKNVKNLLKKKYDIEFGVTESYLKVFLLEDKYILYCYAKEGEIKNREFRVTIDEEGNIKEGYGILISLERLESELNDKFGTENYKIVLFPDTNHLVDYDTYVFDESLLKESFMSVNLCFRKGLRYEDIASLGSAIEAYFTENGYKTYIDVYRDIPDDIFKKILPWWENDVMRDYS